MFQWGKEYNPIIGVQALADNIKNVRCYYRLKAKLQRGTSGLLVDCHTTIEEPNNTRNTRKTRENKALLKTYTFRVFRAFRGKFPNLRSRSFR